MNQAKEEKAKMTVNEGKLFSLLSDKNIAFGNRSDSNNSIEKITIRVTTATLKFLNEKQYIQYFLRIQLYNLSVCEHYDLYLTFI